MTEAAAIPFARSKERCWEIFRRSYPDYVAPDERYGRAIDAALRADLPVLDAGCGRRMEFARRLAPRAQGAVAFDYGRERAALAGEKVLPVCGDLAKIALRDASVGTIVTRSVLEHLERPDEVFREFARVLAPGGAIVAMAPNLFDYASIVSRLTPHSFHEWLVPRVTGSAEEDVFPTFYRANTRGGLRRLAEDAGLRVERIETFCQYPVYLMFSPWLFRLGVAYEKLLSRHESLAGLRGWLLAVLRKPQ
ncbi:MAG TPA: class I SAM-dependent methyltransferase [Planctomycetota bacterium]|nr:class I SAM-dependent methyltransferase [Planctomycetota bacterium]